MTDLYDEMFGEVDRWEVERDDEESAEGAQYLDDPSEIEYDEPIDSEDEEW